MPKVTVHDRHNMLQVFSSNMSKKTEPKITNCKPSDNWTSITFKPDLAKFGMETLESDVVMLMRKRVFDMAGVLGKTVKASKTGCVTPGNLCFNSMHQKHCSIPPIICFYQYCCLYLALHGQYGKLCHIHMFTLHLQDASPQVLPSTIQDACDALTK